MLSALAASSDGPWIFSVTNCQTILSDFLLFKVQKLIFHRVNMQMYFHLYRIFF